MAVFLVLAFIVLPVLEIAVFIMVGDRLGVVATVAAVLTSGLAGLFILRWQGLTVVTRSRQALAEHRMPVREVFEGLLLAISGILLIIPGFVTDGLAVLLLLPPVRALLRRSAVATLVRGPAGRRGGFAAEMTVIDGEWQEVKRYGTMAPGSAPPDGAHPDGRPSLPGAEHGEPPQDRPDERP